MANCVDHSDEIALVRRELKNIRQELFKQKVNVQSDIEKIKASLSMPNQKDAEEITVEREKGTYEMTPVGFISSCFKNKNGIPRQSSLCHAAQAVLELNKSFFTNPEHALIGLNEFSHIWILFVFHKNVESSTKAKVHPPRLNGTSIGVFSTRSPHRPCPIGLSLTKINKIEGSRLFLSGVDILDGTPVLDIKPYIPSYDIPVSPKEINITPVDKKEDSCHFGSENSEDHIKQNKAEHECKSINSNEVPDTTKVTTELEKETYEKNNVQSVLKQVPEYLEVTFTPRALNDIQKFHSHANHEGKCMYCLEFIQGYSEAKQAIKEILQNDPRSVYRRKKCSDKLYYFVIDSLHITSWFDDSIAEVLRIKPAYDKQTKIVDL